MAQEQASAEASTARTGSMSLPSPVSDMNSRGSLDIQPEVLLRGGSYTRPDRGFSNDAGAHMESVPEGRSLSSIAGRASPRVRPPQRAASNLSPLGPTRPLQGPEETYAPLSVTSPSGSGSGFPIGQLQVCPPLSPYKRFESPFKVHAETLQNLIVRPFLASPISTCHPPECLCKVAF